MRYTAVATDPLDFTRVMRVEMGLEPERGGEEPVLVAAVANVTGEIMLEIGGVATETGSPALIWTLDVPHKLQEPGRVIAFAPFGGSLIMRMGLTFWAGTDPSSPLYVTFLDGKGAYAVTASGLTELSSVPLGIEASLQQGIDRACDRLAERMLAIGQLRDLQPAIA